MTVIEGHRSRLPPFGRQLVELRRAGLHGCHGFVRVCLDWSLNRSRGWTVVLPPDAPVAAYRLAPLVAGLDVHLEHLVDDAPRAAEAVRAILPHCAGLARLAFEQPNEPSVEFEVVRSCLPEGWPWPEGI